MTYERKTPIEHVLLRPGMYIGSVEKVTEDRYTYDRKSKSIVFRKVPFVPGLLKVFDEILVNAADNVERSSSTSYIHVVINEKANKFSIENNGAGIPVTLHKKENMYIPELVMGHLLTGSNFNDNVQRFTGGRHGYGAKLTNIMSEAFELETLDTRRGKFFKMKWTDHMTPPPEGPLVEDVSAESWAAQGAGRPWGDYTRISFQPDLSLFGLKKVDFGTSSLMRRRVLDTAGVLASKKVQVRLNDSPLKYQSFRDYAMTFVQGGKRKPGGIAELKTDNLHVMVLRSPHEDQSTQVSFVNSMATDRGGAHVDIITDQIIDAVVEVVMKKTKDLGLSQRIITNVAKKHLALFVNLKIPNPSFDSQMKDKLTSKLVKSDYALPPDFIKQVVSSTSIVKSCVEELSRRGQKDLEKQVRSTSSKSRLSGIPKLEDANYAGRAGRSQDCTLILTEGDSAKSLAVAGLSVVGRNKYGVFPLRGKLLNVRDAPLKQLRGNQEITNLCAILGLQFGKKYDTPAARKTLRYGHVMLMTDQDYDGSHIKGLVINLLHNFWPELLHTKGFLQEFVTPLIKVSPASSSSSSSSKKVVAPQSFFTLPEFQRWEEGQAAKQERAGGNKYKVKYYKGLGTSTTAEAKEYFGNLADHTLTFTWADDSAQDAGNLIEMAFAKDRADDRKDWLSSFFKIKLEDRQYVDHAASFLSVTDFINKELVLFSQHNITRAIPSMMDGLKPSQRKVLFAAFKRNLTKSEIKVGQLAAYCSEHTAYHHGEQSLNETIIAMAQDFVGSQNLPFLVPSGQFGTRLQGGKDASSPRYIFTQLQPYSRTIFHPEDDDLLTYNEDDGMVVEPATFFPIVPTILINGATGIGTGWATTVPAHDPLQVISNLERAIRGEPLQAMKPWVHGFKGEIIPLDEDDYSQGFSSKGVMQPFIGKKKGKDHIVIEELPVGTWTEDFKAQLNTLVETDAIKSFEEHHTHESVLFHVYGNKQQLNKLMKNPRKLRLERRIPTSNMHLFDSKGEIKKYNSPLEIIEEFVPVRLQVYGQRRDLLMDHLGKVLLKLENQARFTQMYCDGELKIAQRSRIDILNEIQDRGFAPASAFEQDDKFRAAVASSSTTPDGGGGGGGEELEAAGDSGGAAQEGADSPKVASMAKDYDYLLKLPLWHLTAERVDALKAKLEENQRAFAELEKTTPEQMWLNDLDQLRNEISPILE